jgi:hypothetical protein
LKRLFALGWLSALLGVLAPACVYDGSERCGPNEQIISADRCACIDGYVPGPKGCVACGDNERPSGDACVCVTGYARPAEGEACEPIPAGLGGPCGDEGLTCEDEFPLCHAVDASSSYCTNVCETDDDCTGGYKCHQDGGYCRRPPVGYGESCKTDDDCSGGEATYCEKIQQHLCLVPCSAGHTDGCFEGEVCCDFVVFSPVCVPSSACAANGGNTIP